MTVMSTEQMHSWAHHRNKSTRTQRSHLAGDQFPDQGRQKSSCSIYNRLVIDYLTIHTIITTLENAP